TIRLVFDLKASVKPQAFSLAPVGDYGHRLVLDIYPLVPPDPLLAFLDRHQAQTGSPPETANREPTTARTEPEVAPSGGRPPLLQSRKGRPASTRLITV